MKTSNVQRPTSNIENWLAALLVGAVLLIGFNSGCQTSAPPTSEAIKFYSFKDTWTAAHTAYQGWCERVVSGAVSKEDEAEVDKAWNQFRVVFKASLRAANQDWTQPTPADLEQAKNTLIIFIRAAL